MSGVGLYLIHLATWARPAVTVNIAVCILLFSNTMASEAQLSVGVSWWLGMEVSNKLATSEVRTDLAGSSFNEPELVPATGMETLKPASRLAAESRQLCVPIHPASWPFRGQPSVLGNLSDANPLISNWL